MPAERWQHVRDVFHGALDRPQAERAAFLASACGDDADLRLEVQSLLAAHVQAEDFLSEPAALPHTGPTTEPDAGADAGVAPGRIGAYEVEGTIGRGGMGTVYRAVRDDDAFRKTVALKVAHGGLRTPWLERRFLQERKILARLQHPHIAMVLDGGTTPQGEPYLVMERVEGQPITDFCVERALGLRERLALFREVCGAVQYAHQNLVIHRDLKPDNILVTAEGVPKLLDFGIAKLLAVGLDPDEAPTATVLPMMTPDYASPEQVRGEAVSTASDVYSLGVLLYELLTGRRPYSVRSQSLPEIVRAVCETEPPLPSAAAAAPPTAGGATAVPSAVPPSALRGDLDTIVMKALRKEPSRRYASVQDLSLDIDRHLRGLPVHARADTLGYRSRKFVSRHKASVTAAALVVASLVAAVVVTRRQARIAEQRFQDTRNLANVLLYEAYDAMREVPGTEAARSVLVKRGLEYHDRLAAQPERDPLLRLEHSTAYVKLGDLFEELGDSGMALDAFGKALVIREQLAAEAPSDFKALQQVGTVRNRLGHVLRFRGDLDRALEQHREAVRIAEEAARALGDAPSRRRIVVAHIELAYDLLDAGRAAEALASAQAAKAVARQIMEEQPSLTTRYDYSAPLEPEGDALVLLGRHEDALARYVEMRDITAESLAARPQAQRYQVDLVTDEVKVGAQLRALGRTGEARSHLENALHQAETLIAQSGEDAEVRQALAEARAGYAGLIAPTQRAEALVQYSRAAAVLRGLMAKDRSNLSYPYRLGAFLLQQADAQRAAGLGREAAASLDEGAAIAADLRRRAPAFRDHQILFARARSRQAAATAPPDCGALREASAAWTALEDRRLLSPEETAESRSDRTAAAACLPPAT